MKGKKNKNKKKNKKKNEYFLCAITHTHKYTCFLHNRFYIINGSCGYNINKKTNSNENQGWSMI